MSGCRPPERRRTPGLRREEVAALAGVGLSWYTWFEQGRDIHVSEKFLLNIAYALKLDDAECSHLFLLAHRRPPSPEARQPTSVSAGIQQLLDELPRPAYVQNLRWDAIAWNTAADDLFRFGSKLPEERNVLELVFADSSMRRRMPAWGDDAAGLLAQLRYDVAVAPDDPLMLDLIETLRLLSPAFDRSGKRPTGSSRNAASAIFSTRAARYIAIVTKRSSWMSIGIFEWWCTSRPEAPSATAHHRE